MTQAINRNKLSSIDRFKCDFQRFHSPLMRLLDSHVEIYLSFSFPGDSAWVVISHIMPDIEKTTATNVWNLGPRFKQHGKWIFLLLFVSENSFFFPSPQFIYWIVCKLTCWKLKFRIGHKSVKERYRERRWWIFIREGERERKKVIWKREIFFMSEERN